MGRLKSIEELKANLAAGEVVVFINDKQVAGPKQQTPQPLKIEVK